MRFTQFPVVVSSNGVDTDTAIAFFIELCRFFFAEALLLHEILSTRTDKLVAIASQVTAKILFGSVAAIQSVNAEKCRKK